MSNADRLHNDSFLRFIDESDRQALLKKSSQLAFKKGDQIVRVKDIDTNIYIIDCGRVRVTLFSNEGKEVSFVDIGKGGNFGELSAIDEKPRSANVIALSDTKITVISPEEFFRLLEKYPRLTIEILRQVTGVVRRLCDRIFVYSTMHVRNRICLEILQMAKGNMDLDGVVRINNPPTQLEIASRVSCTREAISREFKFLIEAGILTKSAKKIVIEDIKLLQEMVDSQNRNLNE